MNNLLGIIIAVVGIVLFVFAISKVYQVRASDELTNAKKTIELIDAKIKALDNGQKSSLTIQGFAGAESWYIVGWNKNDPNRPEKCFFDSCICICEGVSNDVCQEGGICKSVSYSETRVFTTPYQTGYNTIILYKKCIPLIAQLMEINFEADDPYLLISTKPSSGFDRYMECENER